MTIKSKVIKFTTAASFAVAGIATLSAAKLNALSFNNTAQASTVQAPAQEIGVVKVNSRLVKMLQFGTATKTTSNKQVSTYHMNQLGRHTRKLRTLRVKLGTT